MCKRLKTMQGMSERRRIRQRTQNSPIEAARQCSHKSNGVGDHTDASSVHADTYSIENDTKALETTRKM